MSKQMKLETWSGGWGLPSIDPTCLEIMAYAKFSGVPLKIVRTDNPVNGFMKSFGTVRCQLPIFRHGETVYYDPKDVLLHFCKENYNAEFGQRCADSLAYEQMVHTRLSPALMHAWWIDERNYQDVIRPTLAKKLPFPLNYFYPGHTQRWMLERIRLHYDLPGDSKDEDNENWEFIKKDVFRTGKECLNFLSLKLGDSEFFMGESPRFIDAVIFSHLAPLMRIPLIKNNLQAHLRATPNLAKFVDRVLQRYFPTAPEDVPAVVPLPGMAESSRRRNFLICLAGLALMWIYAVSHGHVRVNTNRLKMTDLQTLESAVEDFYEANEDGDQT
ncbi:unnamed protein product [Notodromas monacha]|uniref:Metaxin n=1 Tax=Notodromas monacha TaxID=399045 RepID=A0A7R9BLE2_9CRUS|nr:unnamed protein product [Notodromas monacha]CAG0917369.1 unnamed protein product [Notodromas monacha]